MKQQLLTVTLLGVVFVGCVTIPDTFTANINVTIRHIEEQAGAFLDYVEGESDVVPDFDVDPEDKASMDERASDVFRPERMARWADAEVGLVRA